MAQSPRITHLAWGEMEVEGLDPSRGMERVLQTCPEALEYLTTQGVHFFVAETNEAAQIYNGLVAQGEAVGGLFHSTC